MRGPSLNAKLLFCHGARAVSWREPFDTLTAQVRARNQQLVELAFLEFMQPSFALAVQNLVNRGAKKIDVILLFLAAGGHTRNDVTQLVQAAEQQHPDIEFTVSDTLLESPLMLAATLQWIEQLS
jgi:sirohydrochlorin cobaltochelatase